MNTLNTPTRHGDWHVIDGQLVDLSQNAEPHNTEQPPVVTGSDVDDALPPISLPPIPAPSNKRRNKPTSED